MENLFASLLSLINETLASAIVIVAASFLLYNLTRNFHDRVVRTSALVLGCVTISYVCDVLVSLDPSPRTYAAILRLQWIGIAFLPVALVHLSDALLATTNMPSRGRRRRVIRIFYLVSAVFLLLAAFTNTLIIPVPISPEYFTGQLFGLQAGPAFIVYIIYFLIATVFAWINVGRARRRCLTRDTRRRMGYLQFALLTPAIGIFPFSLLLGAGEEYSLLGLMSVVIANIIIILLLVFLAYPLSFFGSRDPDRVVKVDLLRFFLRGPATGILIIVTIFFINPATRILGIPSDNFLPFAVVAVVLLWQWLVALALPYLERWLVYKGEDREQFDRLQRLSDRLMTHDDLVQLLEATLAATCDYLRVNTAFVISLLDPFPEIISAIGPARPKQDTISEDMIAIGTALDQASASSPASWHGFWILPLTHQQHDSAHTSTRIGIFAIQARATVIDLNEDESAMLDVMAQRAAQTLEDLAVQSEIVASLEGLVPQLTLTTSARDRMEFRPPPTSSPLPIAAPKDDVIGDTEQFKEQVRAALRHYWGGPGLSQSRLLDLTIVQSAMNGDDNPSKALRYVLTKAIEAQKPPGERKLHSPEWTLYNILELRFLKGEKVRDVGLKLAMSEADLYRKQRVAIDAVADTLIDMERGAHLGTGNNP